MDDVAAYGDVATFRGRPRLAAVRDLDALVRARRSVRASHRCDTDQVKSRCGWLARGGAGGGGRVEDGGDGVWSADRVG